MGGRTPRSVAFLAAPAAALALAAIPPAPVSAGAEGAQRPTADVSWHERPTPGDGTGVNTAVRDGSARIRDTTRHAASSGRGEAVGMLTFAPRSLRTRVNRVRASVAAAVPSGASVEAAVRGRTSRGWSEWTPASESPAVLPERVSRVQVRLALRTAGGGPTPKVTGVRLTGDSVPMTARAKGSAARTYNVFATREGLVGHTTANGHVIEERDHFAALPSTRSLSPKGTSDYSVKVCSPDTGRCAFVPVWDVGPWNVHDDYWNPPSVRENWTDLPQGTPEAEAAYVDGYNAGTDGSGRQVLNPAGIDLADGTFWDGLGLTDNAWVDVTYLWTGAYPATAQVGSAGEPVRLHAAPSTTSAEVGLAGQHATVPVYCQTRGQRASGHYGTTDVWRKVGPDMFIPGGSTSGSDAPRC